MKTEERAKGSVNIKVCMREKIKRCGRWGESRSKYEGSNSLHKAYVCIPLSCCHLGFVSTHKNMENTTEHLTVAVNFLQDILAIGFSLLYAGVARILKLFVPSTPRGIKGEVVLVTGGSNGIGKGILVELAKRESDVTLISWDVDANNNDLVVKELKALGVSKAFAFKVDITNKEQVAVAAKLVREEIGEVTMLFNNAGRADKETPVWTTDLDAFRNVMEVNALSHMNTLREFLPTMIKRNSGNIVATCSVLGLGYKKNSSSYVASKHAVKATMECLKQELNSVKADNVRVSLVYPSLTDTNIITGYALKPKKYPFLIQLMQPSDVARQIVRGVLTNEEHIYVPNHMRIILLLLSMLPAEVMTKVYKLYDADP